MKTIAVCSQKGGSGKSTLSRHGSVLLPMSALLDLDPQGTSRRWLEKRKASGLPDPTAVIADWSKVQAVKARAEDAGYKHLVIDTAPEHDDERSIRAAVDAADLTVIPVKPSPDDLEVIPGMLKIIGDRPFVFVLTMTTPNTLMLKQAKELLSKRGLLCPTTLTNRVAFPEAGMTGAAVTEYDKNGPAAVEMTAVFKWIKKQAEKK